MSDRLFVHMFSIEQNIRGQVRGFVSRADAVIAAGNASNDDVYCLEKGKIDIDGSLDALIEVLKLHSKDGNIAVSVAGLNNLFDLLRGVHRVSVLKPLDRLVRTAALKKQAGAGQERNRKKAVDRRSNLRPAIFDVCKGVELVGSAPFAQSIESEIQIRCGVTPGARGYGWRSIQREISAILEECRKKLVPF